MIGNACGKHEGIKEHTGFLLRNLKEKETTRIKREVSLKWTVKITDSEERTGFMWFRIRTSGEELRIPKKYGDFLD